MARQLVPACQTEPPTTIGLPALAFTLTIAFRNLHRNRRRSLLTVSAIAFALICLLVFTSLKNGLHQTMVTTTTTTDIASLQIHGQGYGANLISLTEIPHPEQVSTTLAALGLNTFARRLKASGLLLAGPKSAAVILHGIIPEEEGRVTSVQGQIIQGKTARGEKEILIGAGLAEAFGLELGGRGTIMTQNLFGSTVSRTFTVIGIYQTGVVAFDGAHLFLPLAALQSFLDAEGMISEIAIALPQANPATVAQSLGQRLGPDYQVKTWQEIAPDVTQLIELNDTTMTILIGIVFLLVAMGIVNTMTTITFERFREFGTIAALGATPCDIMALVIAEALVLGLVASAVGSLIGVGCCLFLASHGIDLTSLTSTNQYFTNNHILRAVLDWRQVALTNGFTLLTAALAGLPPAWTAAHQNPAQALSHT